MCSDLSETGCPVAGRFAAAPQWGPVPKAPRGHGWGSLMAEALGLAREGAECGEVPVGAIIADSSGEILARAHNETISGCDPSAHAEILALRRAARRLGNYRMSGCFLVVTLEPCMMCAGAIREARIEGVVYGAADMKAGAVESVLESLEGTGIWHMGGIRAGECASMLRSFFESKR